jgi:hypothetical protein
MQAGNAWLVSLRQQVLMHGNNSSSKKQPVQQHNIATGVPVSETACFFFPANVKIDCPSSQLTAFQSVWVMDFFDHIVCTVEGMHPSALAAMLKSRAVAGELAYCCSRCVAATRSPGRH